MTDGARPPRGVSIVAALTISISALIGIALLALLAVVYPIAQRNTLELARARAQLTIETLAARTRDHLDPAQTQIEHLAEMIARGRLDPADREALSLALDASLAAVPQVSTISFIDTRLHIVRAFHNGPGERVTLGNWSDDPEIRRLVEQQATATRAVWGSFFFAERAGRTYLNVIMPVHRDGTFRGLLIGAVSIEALSDFLTEAGRAFGYRAFILHGRDEVLAHSEAAQNVAGPTPLSDSAPLPRLQAMSDPILRAIWSERRDRALERNFGDSLGVRAVTVDGETILFLFQPLAGYTREPLLVGTYLRFDQFGAPIERLQLIPIVGAATLLGALLVAVLLGRSLALPVRRFGEMANRIRYLDLARVPPPRPGPFKELNESGRAFATMLRALKSFEIYVPRALVRHLMADNPGGEMASEVRDITILFTDVVGFTAMAEEMSAEELAGLLNSHFTLLQTAVAEQQGTVDKYIGDSLMAFWGAPDAVPDHAERACRAAQLIARRVRDDNRRRRGLGRAPIRLRLGLHSGRAFVGNIGAPGRVNYTVVGDVVNIAERLERLGRELAEPEMEAFTLISAETAARLESRDGLVSLGTQRLQGRGESLEVYRLSEE